MNGLQRLGCAVVLGGLAIAAAPAGAQDFYNESFDADLGGLIALNDGATSNGWGWDATCPASPLAGHSSPGDARWGNPATCLDFGGEGSSDRLTTGRITVPLECTGGVLVRFNYFLDFEESACFDRARVEVSIAEGPYFVGTDNGLCGEDDNGPEPGRPGRGNGGNSGVGGLSNEAAWRAGGFLVPSAVPGEFIEVAFVGETSDGLFNVGQGFFVDDLVLSCQPAPYEVPALGPAGLGALGVVLAAAGALALARRRRAA